MTDGWLSVTLMREHHDPMISDTNGNLRDAGFDQLVRGEGAVMSRTTTSRYVLTRAQIEAMARERRRVALSAQVDALVGRHTALVQHARRTERAYSVAAIPVPPFGAVRRDDADELERFLASMTAAITAAEHEVSVVSSQARRAQTSSRLAAMVAAVSAGAGPQPTATGMSNAAATTSTEAVPDRAAARAQRLRLADVERAQALVASIDERAVGDRDFDDVLLRLQREDAAQRHAVLLWLGSEVKERNAGVARRDATRDQLRILTARVERLADDTATTLVARAVEQFEAADEVDLGRAEEAVTHAELVDEQRRQHDRLLADVATHFTRRGYRVVDAAGVADGRFEQLLQGADGSEYAVGLEVDDERVVFTTVRLVDDETAGGPVDPDAPARTAVCGHIAEVVAELPEVGVDVTTTEVSGEDVTVTATGGVVRRASSSTRAHASNSMERHQP